MVKIKHRLYRCCSNCAPWKLIVDNGLEDLWRRENPDLPGFTCYDRSFAKDPRCTGSILISILIQKLLATPRLITMVSFTDHYNAISIDRLPLKTKIGNDSWYFNNSFSCKSEISSATKTFFKKKKKTQKNLYDPLLWMGFNYLKTTATSRRQFTFYHSIPRNSWCLFYRSQKDERLSRPWSHKVQLQWTPSI